MKVSQGVPLK